MLLHAKIYLIEEINIVLFPYALKDFSEQLNELKVYCDGVTTMKNFASTKIDITLKNHHIWGCPVTSWMKGYNATYMAYPSGNLFHMQGSTLVTHNFMKGA